MCGGGEGAEEGAAVRISLRTKAKLYFVAFGSQLPDDQDTPTGLILQVPSYDKRKYANFLATNF